MASELYRSSPAEALRAVDGIGDALARVFERADGGGLTTLAAAREIAQERLRGQVPSVAHGAAA